MLSWEDEREEEVETSILIVQGESTVRVWERM